MVYFRSPAVPVLGEASPPGLAIRKKGREDTCNEKNKKAGQAGMTASTYHVTEKIIAWNKRGNERIGGFLMGSYNVTAKRAYRVLRFRVYKGPENDLEDMRNRLVE